MAKINIIGSGFSSLASACYLAQAGHEVHVFEKNSNLGGRAGVLESDGFKFDTGPSWYWMPDIFERFFEDFNKKPSDYYHLTKLAPAYKIYYSDGSWLEISDKLEEVKQAFEQIEPGAAKALQKFIDRAKYNYEVAMGDLVYQAGVSPMELVTASTVKNVNQFFSSIRKDIAKRFKNKKLIQALEFPVLFLGAKPENTPAFYNFMNYADLGLGTWYPKGGMYKVVEAMVSLGKELGVTYHTESPVNEIIVENRRATALRIGEELYEANILLSGADYVHTEALMDETHRTYSKAYWEKRTFAPSALLFFVGFNKKLKNVNHHTLFFDTDFDLHAQEIYDRPAWPSAPLFYASFPSITDDSVAPKGHECAFFLIPLAPDLKDDPLKREKYFDLIIERTESLTKQKLKDNVVFQKSYSVDDFKQDFNSYKGNAYGMANTLRQTAFLRPKIKSKKISHLYFTGQLTVPGPGVPPALISGKIAANMIINDLKSN